MNAIWITSMILQWAMILVLSLLVLSLMRQLGERGVPATTEKNPDEIFEPFSDVPENEVALIGGEEFKFGGHEATPTLLLFFSPKCPACEQLPEALRELTTRLPSPEFRVLAILKRIDRNGAQEFITEQSLAGLPIALEEDFPPVLNPAGAPFGASIAAGGKVAARGKPKTLPHLLEMAQAAQTMDPSVPSHSRRTHEWGESAPYWMPEQIDAQQPTTA